MLVDAARRLEGAGVEAVAICTNLMHRCAPAVEAAIDVPLLHIADAVAGRAIEAQSTTVGLLGARWVMEETFYVDRLAGHGIRVVIPEERDRIEVDRIIFEELTVGVVREESRAVYRAIMRHLADQGGQAIVLACTEIQLLVRPEDAPVPLIDSMAAHADAVAAFSLGVGPSGRA